MKKHDNRCVDVLRLSQRARRDLLCELSEASQEHYGPDLRDGERWDFEDSAGVIVKLTHPGGSVVRVIARCRNISVEGLGFLHGGYVHPDTACEIALRTHEGKALVINGQVVRCRHVRGRVHEVGVLFDEPIEERIIKQSLLGQSSDGQHAETPPAGQLHGRILYVDDSSPDRALLQYHLRREGVGLTAVASAAEALQAVEDQSFDIVLTDEWMEQMTGHELAARLRERGFEGAIIALTADERHMTDPTIRAAGCDEVLLKPYQPEDLMEVLERYIAGPPDAGRLESPMWEDPEARPVILQFLEKLGEQVDALGEAINAGQVGHAEQLCLDIKGSCGSFGYPVITEQAQALAQEIAREAPIEALVEQFRPLRDLARRAQLKRDSADAESPAEKRSA